MPSAAIYDCEGARLSADERAFFRDADPWGFIVFARHCESAEALRAHRGNAAPYGQVELLVRYHATVAELRVEGLPFVETIASATDAGSGRQIVLPVERDGDAFVVRLAPCPPRTILRLAWPLEDVASLAPRMELPPRPRVRVRREVVGVG